MGTMLREVGIVGLGRMGGGLALQAAGKGIRVVGMTRDAVASELRETGVTVAPTLERLVEQLSPPRAIFLYVPAGPVVDAILAELHVCLAPGDIVVDGGNSYWGDSIRRARAMRHQGTYLVDLGTSGGVTGARHGACFMAGGDDVAVARIEGVLRDLAVPGGFVHAGPSGSGHFAKLVHNGIEFGMLQAIAEGVDLLESSHLSLDIPAVLESWRHGSVIRSWLVDLMAAAYQEHKGLGDVPPYVEDTGEVNWLVADALRMEVPVPVIAQSVMQLFASRDGRKSWARAIAMMRRGFGGHPYGPDEGIKMERRTGRVGPIFEPSVEPGTAPRGL